MLRLKAAAALLDARLAVLVVDLGTLRQAQGSVPLMAHTRMQAALPFTAADKIETWLRPLERHRRRLAEIAPRVFALQLGGPIGVGAARGDEGARLIDALAARLGLTPAAPWHTARDGIVEFGSLLSLMSGALGKLGQDVALLAQNEVGAVRLAQGGGSSAMAHKSNPVGAEVLVALARFNAGLAGTLHQALVHENERSGAAWTLEWMTLPRMAITAGAALRHARALLSGMVFQSPEADHSA
jgi:3-carboxy-cis,cis-muconate cycloisomerase